MFDLFGSKKRVNNLKKDIEESFSHVKKDFYKVGEWIKHLDGKHGNHSNEITKINDQLLDVQKNIIEIKDFISFFGPQLSKDLSKQTQTGVVKHTHSPLVQTPVQTPVQTDILENLTVMERVIVWTLLNAEINLSYEDLAALLGKDKSTIRGQINSIKQKNNGLIVESREVTGKKRLYIPNNIKEIVTKSVKVRIKEVKKRKNR
tara:strand:- start:12852 stop:13463 length:612 start_codon:yes stop_codon:yes gene_type:complete